MSRDFDERALWLARVVLPHEPALRSWLKTRRVIAFEIDDIVQEAYAKLLSLENVADVRDPKAYIFQVAHSILVDHIRRSRVVPIRVAGDIDLLEVESPGASPERQLADRDELRELSSAIASMPNKVRLVFVLRRVHGLDHREIARRLGISKKTVEKRMSAGIRHLTNFFTQGGVGHPQTSNDRGKPLRARHDKTDTAEN
ncbi:RNA polymerase sigma-70 factor (ECF subfamily) [Rhizomicrobium palustre]|uniref:RNA polymerase sigma-70 factor (ECF subfamily) n=1 Tax=Rhizomicrobium palustre TaxID=189966 RepID=A0A846N360_9PROT|nr:sigma-70 family RNA polymerase sigma factor [Rhizomicrobium palustre]NIK89520.1 RNA polymerase sigma-70 factor (ECF subfamily) [Rhizomicrobium palustre]